MSNGLLGDIVVPLVDLLNVIRVLAVCTICPCCLDSCIVITKTMVVINTGVSGRVAILICPCWSRLRFSLANLILASYCLKTV